MSRKELLREFQAQKKPMGVIQITNRRNGRVYIGKAQNPEGILNSLRFQLAARTFSNADLQNDFNRDGLETFDFEIVEWLEPVENSSFSAIDELKTLEAMVIADAVAHGKRGYNFSR